MVFRKLIRNLAAGEIANYIEQSVLTFCEEFLNKNISDSNELLQKLAFNNIRKDFYSNKKIRDRIISVASLEDAREMLLSAEVIVEFTEEQKTHFSTSQSYGLLSSFFDRFISNTDLVDYVLGISKSYSSEAYESFNFINNINPNYGMYPYQLNVNSKLKKTFEKDRRCLLHLPTGAGKTRTAINFICEFIRENPKRLVVWLADRNELCEQALMEFNKAWVSLGNTTSKSYGYFGDSGALTLGGINSGFLVCSVQSLWAVRNSARSILYKFLAESTDLVVFDEAHKAAANTYSEMIDYIMDVSKESLLLGLTATPGRKIVDFDVSDDENSYLAQIFGTNKVTMSVPGYLSPIQYLFEKNYLATPSFVDLEYSDDTVLTKAVGDVFKSDAVEALSDSELRNRAILDCLIKEVECGSYIIVFANTVSHARNLEGLLQVVGINAISIDSSTKERSSIISSYRRKEIQVLINYDVLTAGFDAPHTNVAIIARPTNSLVAYSQMAGRAMRGGEKGNKTCKIYTVNDDIPEFKSVAKAFAHWDRYWVS